MKIDRSKFITITGALAAASGITAFSACTIVSTSGGNPDAASPSDSATNPDGPLGDGETPDGSSEAGADAGVDSPAGCLGDDKVLNPSCSSFAADGGDAGACIRGQEGQSACASYQTNMRNGVARAAILCLAVAPTCEGTVDAITRCGLEALSRACPDPAAQAFCQKEIAACAAAGTTPAVTQKQCEQYASGLNDKGRAAFTSCATEGCALVDTGCFVYP